MKKLSIIMIVGIIGLSACNSSTNVKTNSIDSTNVEGVAPVEYDAPTDDTSGMLDHDDNPNIGERAANTDSTEH